MEETKIVAKDVRVRRESLMCPCGGEYESTGVEKVRGVDAQYQHQCEGCRDIDWFSCSYPQIIYVEVE